MSIKEKLQNADRQTNINKYGVTAHIILQNIIALDCCKNHSVELKIYRTKVTHKLTILAIRYGRTVPN